VVKYLSVVRVVQVVSRDNPADCVSRDSFLGYEERVVRMARALQAEERGRKIGTPDDPPQPRSNARLRHVPPDGEDSEDMGVEAWNGHLPMYPMWNGHLPMYPMWEKQVEG
jgi:hypothetical protein